MLYEVITPRAAGGRPEERSAGPRARPFGSGCGPSPARRSTAHPRCSRGPSRGRPGSVSRPGRRRHDLPLGVQAHRLEDGGFRVGRDPAATQRERHGAGTGQSGCTVRTDADAKALPPGVITSYSIHYTKLYEAPVDPRFLVRVPLRVVHPHIQIMLEPSYNFV